MEWFVIALSILVIGVSLLHMYTFKKGMKKGADDFFKLIAKSGFEMKISHFSTQNQFTEKGGIVFVGDSITQDYNCYEYFSTLKVYNRGIGGDTTEGLLTRLDTSIFQLMPDKVVLLIGTNDFSLLKTTKRKIIENINQIVQEIQQKLPKTKIILQSIYPVNENINPFSVLPRNNADIQAVNQQLAQIKGITFIDMFDLLEKDGKLNAKYSHDGLHLNALGYTKVTEKLKPYLE